MLSSTISGRRATARHRVEGEAVAGMHSRPAASAGRAAAVDALELARDAGGIVLQRRSQ